MKRHIVFFFNLWYDGYGDTMEEKEKGKNWKHIFIIFLVLILFVFVGILFYSHFIAVKKLHIKEYRIVNENLKVIHGYKIAHFSDIHFGKTTNSDDLKKMVSKINLMKPDLLIFTGDLIDKDTTITEDVKEQIESILKTIDKKILKYCIKGEDDLNFASYDFIMENAGFISLDDTYKTLYINKDAYFLLAGLKSTNDVVSIEGRLEEINKFIASLEEKPIYSIFIMHEPDFVEMIDTDFYDLVLAGHSHGGQVKMPFIGGIVYPKYAKKNHQDYTKIGKSHFYITSGIGTTTYGFRLFNPPSFNLYRLVSY